MRFKHYIINEALKPSEFRKYVKNWEKTTYEKIFRRYTNDKHAYRLYFPLSKVKKGKEYIDPEIAKELNSYGYEIESYSAGLARKKGGKGKNLIRIGKILNKFNRPDLLKKFQQDPKRSAAKKVKENLMVVISRHPYDIAGMSTDRGWSSCMNLKDGVMCNYISHDIKEGTLVAYVINDNDKNINNPISRVLIKPYVNTLNPDDILLAVEEMVYGASVSGFKETVQSWLDSFQSKKSGKFVIKPNLYADIRKDGGEDFRIIYDPKYELNFQSKWKISDETMEDLRRLGMLENLIYQGDIKIRSIYVKNEELYMDGDISDYKFKNAVLLNGTYTDCNFDKCILEKGKYIQCDIFESQCHKITLINSEIFDSKCLGVKSTKCDFETCHLNGEFFNGGFCDSCEIFGGTFNNVDIRGSGSVWYKGIWKKGYWVEAKISSIKFREHFYSRIDPNKFRELEKKAKTRQHFIDLLDKKNSPWKY